jgi:hypothetical protein
MCIAQAGGFVQGFLHITNNLLRTYRNYGNVFVEAVKEPSGIIVLASMHS